MGLVRAVTLAERLPPVHTAADTDNVPPSPGICVTLSCQRHRRVVAGVGRYS